MSAARPRVVPLRVQGLLAVAGLVVLLVLVVAGRGCAPDPPAPSPSGYAVADSALAREAESARVSAADLLAEADSLRDLRAQHAAVQTALLRRIETLPRHRDALSRLPADSLARRAERVYLARTSARSD